jgi:hypothetical protein
MRIFTLLTAILLLASATSLLAIEKEAYQLRDDFSMEPLYDCALQHYYYIPCPTYSWFWAYNGWTPGDIVGQWFTVGDLSMGGWPFCDPTNCHVLETVRVLDFAGYGSVHPGLFTFEMDVYCADELGCPVGPSLWNSGSKETHFGWNYFDVNPPLSICDCTVFPGPPPSTPRILVTITHTGTSCQYPSWGMDNISIALETGCDMHDYGCLPALYPRPYSSHYPTIHSGYYGNNGFQYCPPRWYKDGRDTSPDGTQYGFLELAWRIYLICSGPTETAPASWGEIKSLYR